MESERLVSELAATGTGRTKIQALRDLLVRVGMSIVTPDELHRAMTGSGRFSTATIDKAIDIVKRSIGGTQQQAEQAPAPQADTSATAETQSETEGTAKKKK